MAIHCAHCNNLRRGQGGIKIGGRALPTVVPHCPCLSLPRAVFIDPTHIITVTPTFLFPSFAVYDYPMRVCYATESNLKPYIPNVSVTNYPPGDLTFEAFSRIYDGIVEGCTYNDFLSPMAYCNNEDGDIFEDGLFSPSLVGSGFYYAYMRIIVSFGYDIVDVPIVDFTYKFAHSL